MIFLFFSKHQSKAKFKKLDDSEVLRSDFQTLEPMQPPCPLQPHFIKKILILMLGSLLAFDM